MQNGCMWVFMHWHIESFAFTPLRETPSEVWHQLLFLTLEKEPQ
mgnify:FL=1